MAKVGILSMQRIINYGSFLQAYALKTLLEEQGHEVQFVDYRVGMPLIEPNDANKKKVLGKIYKVFEALAYDAPLKQKLQFILYKKQFANKYHNLLGLTVQPNYTPELDVLIIGSDEVFNCVQKNPNVGYSLELFGANNKANKLISYAASFGNTTVEKLKEYNKTSEVGELLKKFNCISVRDENSRQTVHVLTGREVLNHLDPVLAYDYIGKCNRIPTLQIKEKYMILYAYSGRISKEESDKIAAYAKNKGLKIYAIGGVQRCADRFVNCSPFEVLAYFANAEEIITDTFHGTIFSIITRQKFTTLVRKSVGTSYGNEEKLTDLLVRLGLPERIAFNIDEVFAHQSESIDYDTVHTFINKERMRTFEYLKHEVN